MVCPSALLRVLGFKPVAAAATLNTCLHMVFHNMCEFFCPSALPEKLCSEQSKIKGQPDVHQGIA